ncbi:MAG TPA: hypothetical protein VFX97_16675 [Pyrinomonadaceae bacterium]|nr:hypothetical protein [Pyrinomonadaceae bacterium]
MTIYHRLKVTAHDAGCRGCAQSGVSRMVSGGIWQCPCCKDGFDMFDPGHSVGGVTYCRSCADGVVWANREVAAAAMLIAA